MKKKLLITMGCSFTEGVGAYDLNMGYTEKDFSAELYKTSKRRFHDYGWPAFLQKKLKYDELINLGVGGSSNPYAAKRFFELFHNNNLSDEYDVLVIWMLTFPERIGFYKNSLLRFLCAGDHLPYADKVFYNSYVKYMGNYEEDSVLETVFYLKTVETACKLYNFNFLYTTPVPLKTKNNESMVKRIQEIYSSDGWIDSYLEKSIKFKEYVLAELPFFNRGWENMKFSTIFPYLGDPYYKSPVCSHPNENGYKYIAGAIYAVISEFFPQYINTQYEPNGYERYDDFQYFPNEYDNTYDINPKFWVPKFSKNLNL